MTDFYLAYSKHLQRTHDPKGYVLQSNQSLLEKYHSLKELRIPFTVEEILSSHPFDWSEEDEITRKVWAVRSGRVRSQ